MTSQFLDLIYRFLYCRVGNREDAEDLTTEVFLKAPQQLHGGSAESRIAEQLLTVARIVLAEHWHRFYQGGVIVQLDDASIVGLPESGQAALARESETLVRQVLDALPEVDRRVLELRFLQGHSTQEMARELGVTPEDVPVIQRRALAKAVQAAERAR